MSSRSDANRPNASTSINHCIQYMINYLNRTQANPNIRNPLSNRGTLSAFNLDRDNTFTLALRHCRGRNDILDRAINAIKNEIAHRVPLTQWALTNGLFYETFIHTEEQRNHIEEERNQIIASLQGLLTQQETPAPTDTPAPTGTPGTPGRTFASIRSQSVNTLYGLYPGESRRLLSISNLATLEADDMYSRQTTFGKTQIIQVWNNDYYKLMRAENMETLRTNQVYLELSSDDRTALEREWSSSFMRQPDPQLTPLNVTTRSRNLAAAFNQVNNIPQPDRKSLSKTYSDVHSKKQRTVHSSNSIASLNSSVSETTRNIHELCATKFKDIDIKQPFYAKTAVGRPIKSMINKYRKICHTIINPTNCYKKDVDRILVKLQTKYLKPRLDSQDEINKILIRNATINNEFIHLFKIYIEYKNKNPSENIFDYSIETFYIIYLGQQGIDAGGLQRQFFTNVATQLFTYGNPKPVKKPKRPRKSDESRSPETEYENKPQKGIFVEVEDKSNIYIFNKNLDTSLFTVNGKTQTESTILEFAGKLYAWLMINRIKCQNRLSKAILINLLYSQSEITNDDYGIILLLESQETSNSFMDLIKYANNELQTKFDRKEGADNSSVELPKIIDYLYIDFTFNEPEQILKPTIGPHDNGLPPVRSEYSTKEKYDEATKRYDEENIVTYKNIQEYIGLTGHHDLLGTDNTLLHNFKSGFFVNRRYMKNRNFSVPLLDFLTYGLEITKETIEKIISEVEANSNRQTNPKVIKMIDWFKEILRGGLNKDYNKILAIAKTNTQSAIESGVLSQAEYDANIPKTFEKFLPKLLKFWGGSSSYYNDPRYPYRINFEPRKSGIISHTCFFKLDIPIKINDGTLFVNNAEELFVKLLMCIILSGDKFNDA